MNSGTAFSQFRAMVSLVRPRNAVPPVLALLIGFLLTGRPVNMALLTAGAMVIFLAHSWATLQNDIEDLRIDRSNNRTSILLRGEVTVRTARQFGYVLAGATLLVTAISQPVGLHLLFAALFFGLAWSYNSAPLFLSRRPLTSIVVMGLFYGVLPLLYGLWLGDGTSPVIMLFLVLAWFLARCSISILKDYKDHTGDAIHNKQTFLLCFGPEITRRASVGLAVIAYGIVVGLLAASYVTSPLQIALLGVTVAGVAYTIYLRASLPNSLKEAGQANRQFHKILMLTNFIDLAIIICLLSY